MPLKNSSNNNLLLENHNFVKTFYEVSKGTDIITDYLERIKTLADSLVAINEKVSDVDLIQ